MSSMSDLQNIIERHAAATPGPHFVEVIDDHAGNKTWLICDLARERYGDNTVSFGEDEATARFVAASFTDVPAMAAALQRAHAHLADMEQALASGQPLDPRFFELAAAGLRNALALDGAE
jgi:cell wall assembly regulator SMI1